MPLKSKSKIYLRNKRAVARVKTRSILETRIIWPYLKNHADQINAWASLARKWPTAKAEKTTFQFPTTPERRTAKSADDYVAELLGADSFVTDARTRLIKIARINREVGSWKGWLTGAVIVWEEVEITKKNFETQGGVDLYTVFLSGAKGGFGSRKPIEGVNHHKGGTENEGPHPVPFVNSASNSLAAPGKHALCRHIDPRVEGRATVTFCGLLRDHKGWHAYPSIVPVLDLDGNPTDRHKEILQEIKD